MSWGSDRVGYGNCQPTESEWKERADADAQVQEIIRIRKMDSFRRTEEEQKKLDKWDKG